MFYSISLNVSIIEARLDAREKLSKQITIQGLTLIKVHSKDAKGIEEKELWYNDKLYDIAKTIIINDTVYYYALEDNKEQEAIAMIHEYFSSEFNSINPQTLKLTVHKISIQLLDQLYNINSYGHNLYRHFSLFVYIEQNKSLVLEYSKVLTPPPKFIFSSHFNI